MIVTEQPKRLSPRLIQGLILLIAIVVLPLGAHLYAKEKPEPKEPLKTAGTAVAGTYEDSAQEYLDQVWEKLSAEVKAGNLTKDEANARHEMIKMSVHVMACEEAMYKAQQKMTKAEFELAIASGKISEKEAQAKLGAVAEGATTGQKKQDDADAKMIKGWDKLTVLLDEGMITFEDAAEEYLVLKHEAYPKSELDSNVADALAKYQEAVKAGKMTNAEAYDRLRYIDMAYYAKRLMSAEQKYYEESVRLSLQAMVTRGEITQEEADAKLKKIFSEGEVEVKPSKPLPEKKKHKEGE